jgi:hypothetical protein
MLCTEISLDINRPAAEVFTFVTGIAHRPMLTPTIREEAPQTPGPLGPGSYFTQRISLLDQVFEVTLEVSEYDPPRHFGYRTIAAPFPFAVYCYLAAQGESTHLGLLVEGAPGDFFAVEGPALVAQVTQQLLRDLEQMKTFLEEGARHPRLTCGEEISPAGAGGRRDARGHQRVPAEHPVA